MISEMVEYFLRFWEFRARNLLIEVFKSIYPYETHYIQLLNYIYIYIYIFFFFSHSKYFQVHSIQNLLLSQMHLQVLSSFLLY